MNGYCMLDFSNGISFFAFKTDDVEAFERALDQHGITFKREWVTFDATTTDGKPMTIVGHKLVINPEAGTEFIKDMFQSLSRG